MFYFHGVNLFMITTVTEGTAKKTKLTKYMT